MRNPNAQYNVSRPDSFTIKLASRVRAHLYRDFVDQCKVTSADTILDVGATSDQSYASSNYLEALHPSKDMITACGIDDATFLERLYPGLKFVFANGLDLPFDNRNFDFVHASAVIEHIGSYENQIRLVHECARVARKGFFLTTPNRYFPIEFHTQMPLIHWLPKRYARPLFKALGYAFMADEANVNLLSRRELEAIAQKVCGYCISVYARRLWGWPSNFLVVGQRLDA